MKIIKSIAVVLFLSASLVGCEKGLLGPCGIAVSSCPDTGAAS